MNLLKLNEKNVRKGKPVGLPYVGSKKKVSKKTIEIIKENFGTDKKVYDLFGGGGAITLECIIQGLEVHYNEIDENVSGALQLALDLSFDEIASLMVPRKEFEKIRDKEYKTPKDTLILLVNSFGNQQNSYLYSKEMSDIKYNLAKDIIKNHKTFKNYKNTETYKNFIKKVSLERLQQLQQLEQLQQLQQLVRLQQVQQLKRLQHVTNKDYKEFAGLKNSIVYLDPPYNNVSKRFYDYEDLDWSEFLDFCIKLSKDNIVLISSYEINDDRFYPVYHFGKSRSAMQPGYHSKKYDKLFMVKEGQGFHFRRD